MRGYIIIAIGLLMFSCSGNDEKSGSEQQEEVKGLEPQVVSLLGITYYEPVRAPEVQEKLEKDLEEARQNFEENPSEMNYIWYGRRTAYLSRYKEAIEIYTQGLDKYPESYRLLRHRGHRYISLREFDQAIEDLEMAASLMPKDTLETEPDGMPNRLNQPLSSTQFNVWYHLGLAYYLQGEFKKAKQVYDLCLLTSVNNDLLCATADWKYMTHRRLDESKKADALLEKIAPDIEVIENQAYLNRLMMYKGTIEPQELLEVSNENQDPELTMATQGYGVGNYYLYNGDTTRAVEVFKQVIKGDYWSAFGFIAAEAELARMESGNEQ
ncbi:MAG: tetratricopeptide repeat protein [Fulvivirga sp.]|nr:tetratricopeptide repeat protein [Fulvivirga sp.]